MWPKPKEVLKIAILLPAYKRPEYTLKCIKALEVAQAYPSGVVFYLIDDGSEDTTQDIFRQAKLPKEVIIHSDNRGLRSILIDFLNNNAPLYDFIGKIDNDCVVPKNWLNDILEIFNKTDVDILSPNVYPSNAAFKYGQNDTDNVGYRPAQIVGGLWFMKSKLTEGIYFEKYNLWGIKGAFNILKQIILDKEPKVGWTDKVLIQDLGHWSGIHPEHIKTKEHRQYYQEVGRNCGW